MVKFTDVLLVEDDPITIMVCDRIMKMTFFAKNVTSCENGKIALDYLLKIRESGPTPKIIFLDINMPVMNGWDFLEDYVMKYSDRLPDTKVVIVSSTVNPEDFSKANKYHLVIDFINKPLTIEGMEELMENEQICQFFA